MTQHQAMTSELQAIEFATRCASASDGESEARWMRNGLAAGAIRYETQAGEVLCG